MSFKYFLDMAPEDPVIYPSSLTKFRRLRLQDDSLLDLLIQKTVEIAVEDYENQLDYSTDPDARVGYKTHIAINDERLITAAIVTTGEQSDGKYLQDLIGKSLETGMEIETVLGDTAYSGKDNILYAKENELELVSKLNPQITQGTRTKEEEFEFNKDAGMVQV